MITVAHSGHPPRAIHGPPEPAPPLQRRAVSLHDRVQSAAFSAISPPHLILLSPRNAPLEVFPLGPSFLKCGLHTLPTLITLPCLPIARPFSSLKISVSGLRLLV